MKTILYMSIGMACVSGSVFAQKIADTVYLTESMKITSRNNAMYFRLISVDSSKFKVEDHFMNGKMQMSGSYTSVDQDIKDGWFRYYSVEGGIEYEGNYKENKKEGQWKEYYKSGKLHIITAYSSDNLDGEFSIYYEDGKTRRKEEYRDGTMQKGSCYSLTGTDTTYFPFQQIPAFKGDMNQYISEHLIYPVNEKNKNVQGKVYIEFAIDKDGSVINTSVFKGVSPALDSAAVRVISSMPQWSPGMQDGKPIIIYLKIPIEFSLQ